MDLLDVPSSLPIPTEPELRGQVLAMLGRVDLEEMEALLRFASVDLPRLQERAESLLRVVVEVREGAE